jgi:hypothetical protein
MKQVVSIQYPSGGFGHTIHVILSMFGKNFACNPLDHKFGIAGDSHQFPELLPKMFNVNEYNVEKFCVMLDQVENNKNVTILIDSGISDDTVDFKKIIHPHFSIRICYDDWSWPLLAKMFYTRCMSAVDSKKYQLIDFINPDHDKWPSNESEDWAVREKYFLYLRDHPFRHCWRPVAGCVSLPVEQILNYTSLHITLNQWFNVVEFEDFYKKWYSVNKEHFDFHFACKKIIDQIEFNQLVDLSNINDLFDQAVINYYIWLKYNFEVPHNDYAEWFTNTKDITIMLKKYGVSIDSH